MLLVGAAGLYLAYTLPITQYWLLLIGISVSCHLLYVCLSVAARRVYYLSLRRQQTAIDQAAMERVSEGGHYFLYLRSFHFEPVIRVREDNKETIRSTCWFRIYRTILQAYVAVALKPYAPTLGIGGVSSVGMTTYTTSDESWREDFRRLASGATGIFVLPSATEGSTWELEWLVTNALKKTLFIVPPADSIPKSNEEEFWDHYDEFIKRHSALGFLQSKAFNSTGGGILRAQVEKRTSQVTQSCLSEIRKTTKLSLELLSEHYDIPVDQLRYYEEGGRVLEGAAVRPLLMIDQHLPFSPEGFAAAGKLLLGIAA